MKSTVVSSQLLRICAISLWVISFVPGTHAGDDPPPEPTGYWQGPMNGKVPSTITGGRVIGTEELSRLIQQEQPTLVDVAPAPRRPSDRSMPWLPLPHRSIPQSVWIPGAGSGAISSAMADYFHGRLTELTGHNREKLIIFCCRLDCWASWNAAKRAIDEGYRQVRWYPDGLEAWQAAGLPTEAVEPEGPSVR